MNKIKEELREAIKKTCPNKTLILTQPKHIEKFIDDLINALLPIITKYAPSLCEVDEGKLIRIINRWNSKIFYNTPQNIRKLAHEIVQKQEEWMRYG